MQVNLENNRYSLIFNEATGTLLANRNGEYWMDYTGSKLLYCLMARIVELEAELVQSTENKDSIYDVRGHLLNED